MQPYDVTRGNNDGPVTTGMGHSIIQNEYLVATSQIEWLFSNPDRARGNGLVQGRVERDIGLAGRVIEQEGIG